MMSNVGRVVRSWGFGRRLDAWRIEAEGFDWVVVRHESGEAAFEHWPKPEYKQRDLDRYAAERDPWDKMPVYTV